MSAILEKSAAKLKENVVAASIVASLSDAIESSPLGGPRTVTTLTVEQGFVKVLVACGPKVVSHHVALANNQFFREGLISDSGRVATIMQKAVARAGGGKPLYSRGGTRVSEQLKTDGPARAERCEPRGDDLPGSQKGDGSVSRDVASCLASA